MRNTKGYAIAPDKDEKVKAGSTEGGKEESAGKRYDPASHLANCEDCMMTVTKHMGSSGAATGMKSEDQGGKTSGAGRGHDTTKASTRQRH
jgi:hypothetical protein